MWKRFKLWHLLAIVLGIFFFTSVYPIYLEQGMIGVVKYLAIVGLIFILLLRIGTNAQLSAVLDCLCQLEIILIRLYNYSRLPLPLQKSPNDIKMMSSGPLISFTKIVLNDKHFWNELPDKIGYQSNDFAGIMPEIKKGESFQTKEYLRKELSTILKILDRDIELLSRKVAPNPRE